LDDAPKAPSQTLRPRWILAHLVLLASLAWLSHSIYRDPANNLLILLFTSAGIIVGVALVASGFLALSPKSVWLHDLRSLGTSWAYAAVIGVVGTSAIGLLQALWRPASTLTFYLVTGLVKPFLPTLQADPNQLILNTGRFAIQIADACSGLEGIGLILAFCVVWLTYFRREYLFPRSLWIIPIGVLTMFALNTVRIAALLLIGHAGYPDVALFGFHSQAGWIAFIIGAGAVVLLSRRPIFLRRDAVSGDASTPPPMADTNPTAAYLVPLLAILAAGMLSRATSSGDFEALYPLRLVAGVGALWAYRKTLRRAVDWSFTWRGPLAGVVIGTVTIVFVHFLPTPDKVQSLATLPLLPRLGWVIIRCAATIVTVPLAEELAYRGFLMRRLARPDFEAVPFTSVSWWAICVSAVVSAAIQGSLFLPAVLAGVAYGALIVHRGRFGEGAVAHAVANGIAVAALWHSAPW
jgi:exosortase E/protease (VPEID-CTERM system)